MTDFLGKEVVDFRMSRDSGNAPGVRIEINAMFGTLADENTAVHRKMPDEVTPFHGEIQKIRPTPPVVPG